MAVKTSRERDRKERLKKGKLHIKSWKERTPTRGSGVGTGLQIDVPAGAGDNDLGTLTVGTSAPVSRQSSFGDGKKAKASRKVDHGRAGRAIQELP